MHDQDRRSAAPTPARGPGFLTRLRQDARGNTLAIVAAALFPLLAMIGSGIDMSRAYMAKARLQSACDAGALAGRRIMQNDTLNQTVIDEARRFFAFNFRQGLYQTTAFTPNVTRPSAGTVRVAASTRIPNTIMSMFGFDSIPLNVTCDASLNFVNTDVMLVLDVTGSMDDTLNGTRKIVSLRDAVMAFYDELRPIQTQLEANSLRLRYGVVPYSTTVNVGALIREANADFLADSVTYQSRVANYDNQIAEYTGEVQPPSPAQEQVFDNGRAITQLQCDKYGLNERFTYTAGGTNRTFNPSATTGGGPAPQATWTRAFSNNETAGQDWGWSGASDSSTGGSDNRMSCRRRYVQTNTEYEVTGYHYLSTGYTYQEEPLDVSQYKMGTTITYATNRGGQTLVGGSYDPIELAQAGTGMNTTTATWNGCIQERDTVSTITGTSGTTIPADAFDLNIDLIPDPDDPRTLWRPMIPQLYWGIEPDGDRVNQANNAPCPAAARRLQAWTRDDLLAYVNALQPTGNTYHDIGMIWGARMISNAGIFADSPNTFAGMPVARHIIFMTDGVMDANTDVFTFHGPEVFEHRVGGTPTPRDDDSTGTIQGSMENRHMQRFRMVCSAARTNAQVWVIAFGSTMQPHMLDCASSANHAFTAANRDQLIARFREIGSQIGALRLTQ
ncbi:Tad domain-containing protein [Sphingosinicella sp. LHD-64]|uniref:pilus assembly protein n=1 Tax=Sphingosinicella sp. LHD-64 TaxID=3072139 RepID=UPI00280C9D5A|nr:Tad domain-containing protein [Sphingosinicella sp. LHD-64]MDQ8757094.1 Tad domain-containing protein [Sphingosinicella sp. LHD-64]